MPRANKQEVIGIMEQLRQAGYSQEELAVALGRTQQTIWAWGSKAQPTRVPCKMEFSALKQLLEQVKE